MSRFFRKSDEPEIAFTISTETFIRLAFLSVATFILIFAVRKAAHALLLIFLAFFLSLALNGPVHWLSQRLPGKRKNSRILATSLSYLLVVLLLVGFLASLVPPLVRQTESFAKAAPGIVRDFRDQNSTTGRFIREHKLEGQVNKLSHQLSDRIGNIGGQAFSTIQSVGTSIFSVLTILVLTFMMLVEGPRWIEFSRQLVPDRHQNIADKLALDMYKVIKGYINGQVTLAALAAVLIIPAVLVLGISYPAALLVIIFVCGLIPMVGHTIGAIIITLVALGHSTSAAIIILIYYILYQQIENVFIQPRIQANSTNMSPLLVFSSVVIGVSFGGLFGGLLAIPIAGCIRIAILEYLSSRRIIAPAEVRAAIDDTK